MYIRVSAGVCRVLYMHKEREREGEVERERERERYRYTSICRYVQGVIYV